MNEVKRFEEKVKPLLEYIGTIGAVLTSIAYIITVFVLIYGFKANDVWHTTVFGIVNAVVGFVIMQFLKIQGEALAKNIKENKDIITKYYSTKTKDKKLHSMTYYWITSVIKDLFVKCLTIAVTSIGLIYIVIEGTRDYRLILLAVVNLIMFICFGLLALNGAYEFYNNKHIPFLKDKIKQSELDKQKEIEND